MTFEDILDLCLDALEHGETIEDCLTRYPQHAGELAPLLSLATAVRSAPQPRLSASAFARGQAAVAAQAHYQQPYYTPFQPLRRAGVQPSAPLLPRAQSVAVRQLTAPPPPLARPFLFIHKAQTALLAGLVVLSLFALARNVSISLPGAWLYPAKRLGENMGGMLLTAAGEQATWHAQQTENRLQELVYLAQQGKPENAELEQAIDRNLVATLAESNQLSPAQRNEFLQAWLTRLQTIDQANPWPSTATVTLNRAVAKVQSATQVTIIQPTPEPTKLSTSAPTPKLADSRIIIPTATANPITDEPVATEQTTPPALETALPLAPVVIHPTTIAPALAPADPLVIATATTAVMVMQAPQAAPTKDNNRHHTSSKPAVPQPEATTAGPDVAAASAQTLANDNRGSGEVHSSTNSTTSVASAPEQAASANRSETDKPTKTPTPTFGVADNPSPAIDNGPALAATSALVTAEATSATPAQTANPGTGTPSTEKTSLPTRLATVVTTPNALPSGTASEPATPVVIEPTKTVEPTATDEATERPEPTVSVKLTQTPEPTDTPDHNAATLEAPATVPPDSTPTPQKHK